MVEALVLGMVAQSSLLLSGLLVYWVHIPTKVVGALAGFGAGALISAIAFDLIPEAELLGPWQLVLWMLLGAAVLLAGDAIVERRFGDEGAGGAMGIVVGSVVDGVPESLIFGIQIAAGSAVSAGFLAAVLVSNVPQAIAPSADLAKAGWSAGRTARLWLVVIASCGVAAAAGWAVATLFPGANGDRAAALAAGGLLAMLTNSLMPFAYERGGELAGVATVVGFCLAIVAN
jgi:zinc transporter, ZIP family